jgi:hypothetical protein
VKKISATILDFATPLTDGLRADASLDLRRETLGIAITLWNTLVLQACGQGEYLAELLERFRKMPERYSLGMAPLIQAMILRRHALYADDLRLVGNWELRDLGNGEVSLRAVAHAPPKT